MVSTLYQNIIIDSSKPHLILIPTWNSDVSRRIGLHSLVKSLRLLGVSDADIWSVGFERNLHWQPIPYVSNIIPIPYVVTSTRSTHSTRTQQRPSLLSTINSSINSNNRVENSVFFVGDYRPNAGKWAGCFRSNLTQSLLWNYQQHNSPTSSNQIHNNRIDIRLVHKKDRVNQTVYNRRMRTSDYCLILCGDTPTSRSLSSAIVEGCIPIRVGSRLRGLCDPPCHESFGWTKSGLENPHLPFGEIIPWEIFPEIDEKTLLLLTIKNNNNNNDDDDDTASIRKNREENSGNDSSKLSVFETLFRTFDEKKKKQLRTIMGKFNSGFIYGYGDPVRSEEFGDAASYIWESFVDALHKKKKKNSA